MVIRLGVIVLSGNTLLETELCSLPINGVSFHFTRVVNYLDTEEELAAMGWPGTQRSRVAITC